MKNNCFFPADILLPKTDLERWAVIACDQYTSDPGYWRRVEQTVGNAPSALRLILPEVYLGQDDDARIAEIDRTMRSYLDGGVFETLSDAMIYTERVQSDGAVRRGLIGCIDLNCYDYRKGARAAIRATEETVLERIPPRVHIRENAPLELPHILLLIDDPEHTVIEPLGARRGELAPLYDFELMQNGGRIAGRLLDDRAQAGVQQALDALYERGEGLLFCVGDGNHSLAAAKESYEQNPAPAARYALAEVVNIHDPALRFEPIYRVVFGLRPDELISRITDVCGGAYSGSDAQRFTCVFAGGTRELSLRPSAQLPVGTLQAALDRVLRDSPARIDYIHGADTLKALCRSENTVGFLFDGMEKQELFPAVRADGALPRKTFSMGHADDKRFYLEARVIR